MELIVRATVVYWFLFLVMRGTGRRSLAELTPMDILILVVIGDMVQQGVTQEDMSLTGAVMAVSVFTAWTLVGDWAARRWKPAERVLAGGPVIVVRHGEILEDRLASERLTVDDLKAAARGQGIAGLDAVAFAVVEEDGSVSIIAEPAEKGAGA